MIGQAARLLELNKLKAEQSRKSSDNIIAFTSGKGGTGKTFLSLNLAYSLAEKGNKILFVDLDFNLSNANIMINFVADDTLADFFAERKLLRDLITEYRTNLHFIFGDSGHLRYPEIHRGIVSKFFNELYDLQDSYDFIFLDLGSGAGEEIVSFLGGADSVILVTTPEPTSVMDSYVMLKLLNSEGYKGKKYAIVNKTMSGEDGESAFGNLSAAAGHFLKDNVKYLGDIRFDMQVSKSIIDQELLLIKHPELPVSLGISALGNRISEFVHMANILHTR